MNEQASTPLSNWRQQLAINNHRTHMVMGIFILTYAALGLLIDCALVTHTYSVTLQQAFMALISLQVIPKATLIMFIVAAIALFVTVKMSDQLMLLGTEYHEVTADTTDFNLKQLYNTVEEMKIAAGLNFMPKVYLIEAPYLNAFASGYSEKSAMVAITRGLLEKLNRSEIQAVMAHEMSHIRHLDIKLTLMASVLSNIMLLVIDVLFQGVIFGRVGREDEKEDNKLALLIVILRFVLPLLNVLLMLYLSRTREFMADAGAVELMRDNTPLAQALMKISGDYHDHASEYQTLLKQTPHEQIRREAYIFDPNMAGLSGIEAVSGLFATHPSLDERLAAMGYRK